MVETVTYTASGGSVVTASVAVSGVPAGVTLTDIDGGAHLSTVRFPIAVWYESVLSAADSATDAAMGLNTYVVLTADSLYSAVAASGMTVMPQFSLTGTPGAETVGYLTGDEVDMSITGWWGAPTAAQQLALNAAIASSPKDGRPLLTNFGKGIAFGTNVPAAQMMLNSQDIISCDIYWFTDSDVYQNTQGGVLFNGGTSALTVAQTRRASNYGAVVAKMRSLLGFKKPVWGFVENGGPFSYNTTYITPAQMRAAVWHSIIAGAQGILYFNHTFGGPARGQHNFRTAYYAPTRAVAAAVNAQIQSLAAALLGPTATGLVSAPASVKVLAKWNGGAPVIVAGSTENVASTVTFTVAGHVSGTVTVLGESRTIPLVAGVFTDAFADGNTIHIYKVQ